MKLQAFACNFIQKKTLTHVFSCEICEISKNAFSYRTPPVAASKFCDIFKNVFFIEHFQETALAFWKAILLSINI